MAKKQKRAAAAAPAPAKKRKKLRVTASTVFVGLLLLFAAIIGVASMFAEDAPVDCPRGQVWSDAHGHCH